MQKEIEAVVLAGGRGAKMGEITRNQQKCLLPVDEKPILYHILENIQVAFGSAKVVIATGYLGENIKKLIGTKFGNLEIEYVHNPNPLETKNRLLLAESVISHPFLFLAGDVIVHPAQLEKVATNFESDKPTGILGVVSGAIDHKPALSHVLISEKDDRVTELVFPPPAVWGNYHLREMHVAYYDKGFFKLLCQSPHDILYLSTIISNAIKAGTEFAVVKYSNHWYHFSKQEDLQTNIVYDL